MMDAAIPTRALNLVSLVVPVFNEQEGLPQVYRILTELMEGSGLTYEVVISDNGSTDNTEAIMQDIARRDPRWRYIRLSRNFGYENSISLGIKMASGDVIITIDADLQDPPEMILDFIEYWRQGYDIVYGVRTKRTGEPRTRIMLTMLAHRFINWMADYPLPAHGGDFRLIDRKVRDAFVQMPEASRYARGMIHWVGFRQKGIEYVRRGRQFDTQKRQWGMGLFRLFGFMLDAIFSFSLKPLRLFSLIGALVMVISVFLFFLYFVVWLIDRQVPPGHTTQLLISIVHMGITALGIGILGEYIGRLYAEAKQRPLWIVDYMLNFDNVKPQRAIPPNVNPHLWATPDDHAPHNIPPDPDQPQH